MRSQKEILEHLSGIEKSKGDHFGVQWKTLSRKLTWENARPYINSKYHNDTREREKWKQSSRLDEKSLMENIENLMDKAVENYYQHEYVQDLANIHVFMCLVWLLGSSKTAILNEIVSTLYSPDWNPSYDTLVILQLVCTELGLKWSTYESRYNPKARGKIILPGEEGYNVH